MCLRGGSCSPDLCMKGADKLGCLCKGAAVVISCSGSANGELVAALSAGLWGCIQRLEHVRNPAVIFLCAVVTWIGCRSIAIHARISFQIQVTVTS